MHRHIGSNDPMSPAAAVVFLLPDSKPNHRPCSKIAAMNNRLAFFRNVPLFADLTDAQLEMLADDFTRRDFRHGETIFLQGDPGQTLYLIKSGKVRIYVQDDDGQETSVILYGPGDIFGELALIDGMPRSASAVALEDTVVYLLSRERFREQIQRTPQLAWNLLRALSVRLRYSTEEVGSLAFQDVPARLARKLLELAERHSVATEDGVCIDALLTQSDLASFVGATRESINKTLSVFKRQGLIKISDGRLIICNREALRGLCS